MDSKYTLYLLRLFLPFILLTCLVVYWPGLNGGFLFDDFPNIIQNPKLMAVSTAPLSIQVLYDAISHYQPGPVGRPVSFLTIALNLSFSGLDPYYFKLTNLIIHLVNGILVYYFLQLLFKCYGSFRHAHLLACLTAAAWILHPFQVNSVLYVIQRMMELSTLFSLATMILYICGRLRLINGQRYSLIYFALIPLTFALALFSKENGVLIIAYLFAIEYFVLRFRSTTQPATQLLKLVFTAGLIIGLPCFFFVMYKLSLPAYYEHREFGLSERVFTETRVIWSYIHSIVLPDISKMSIYHDDIILSKNLFNPPTTFLSITGIIGLLILAYVSRSKHALFTFGICFFFSAHLLESTTVPLEIMHEHRNYLASLGLLLSTFYALIFIFEKTQKLRLLYVFSVLFISFLAGNTFVRATIWGDELLLAEHHAQNKPSSIRSLMDAGATYLTRGNLSSDSNNVYYWSKALKFYHDAYNLKPVESHALLSIVSILHDLGEHEKNKIFTDKLLQNLSQEKITTETMNSIVSTSQCIGENTCSFPIDLFENMTKSLLKNPNLSTLNVLYKGQIYSLNSNFALLNGNLNLALEYNQKAIKAWPYDAQHFLNHAALLINAGKPEQAQQYLIQAREVDGSNFILNKIASLEKTIDNQGLQRD